MALIWVQNFTIVPNRKSRPLCSCPGSTDSYWCDTGYDCFWSLIFFFCRESAHHPTLRPRTCSRIKWEEKRSEANGPVIGCSDWGKSWVRLPQRPASFCVTATCYQSKTPAGSLPQQPPWAIPRPKAQIQLLENQLTKHRISWWKGSVSSSCTTRMMCH